MSTRVQLSPQKTSHWPALQEAWSRQQVIAQAAWDPGEVCGSKKPLDNGHFLRAAFCSQGTCPKNTIWEPLWSGQPLTPAKRCILHNVYQDDERDGKRKRALLTGHDITIACWRKCLCEQCLWSNLNVHWVRLLRRINRSGCYLLPRSAAIELLSTY